MWCKDEMRQGFLSMQDALKIASKLQSSFNDAIKIASKLQSFFKNIPEYVNNIIHWTGLIRFPLTNQNKTHGA